MHEKPTGKNIYRMLEPLSQPYRHKMARKNPVRGSKQNLAPQVVEDTNDKDIDIQNHQEAQEAKELVDLEEGQDMSATEESDETDVDDKEDAKLGDASVDEKEDDKEEDEQESSEESEESEESEDDDDSSSESEGDELNFDDISSLLDASSKFQAESEPVKSLDEITERYARLPKIDGGVGYGTESLTEKGLMKDNHYDYTKEDNKNKFAFRVIQDPHQVKLDKKEARDNTAGDKWFGMKAPDMTPELKMDMELLKMRNVLDPKRFYKKSDSKKDPKFFEMGTIVEGNTEFFSARLTKKERKQTFAQELLGDDDSQKYFKRKYAEIGDSKEVGRKKHFQNLKDLRKKRR